jgi:hypothetical protein
VVPDNALAVAFLSAYERARFSSQPLSDEDFQALMRMFAELLRNMAPVEIEMLDLEDDAEDSDSHFEPPSQSRSGASSLMPRKPSYHTRHDDENDDAASIPSTYSSSGSVRHHKTANSGPPRRISEDSAPSLSSCDDVFQSPSNYGLGLAVEPGHGSPTDSADVDGGSLHTAPTSTPTPRPGSRPRPPLRASTGRMYSALSRQPSHPDDSSSLRSDTGSVVHNDLAPHISRSSTSSTSRRRHKSNGRSVISLAHDSEQGHSSHGHDLPYRIEVPAA